MRKRAEESLRVLTHGLQRAGELVEGQRTNFEETLALEAKFKAVSAALTRGANPETDEEVMAATEHLRTVQNQRKAAS